MTEKTPKTKGGNTASDREARLKAALNANLARRKAQARARTGDGRDDNKTEKG